MASNAESPAAPVAQTTEAFTQIRQHCGLSKREAAAIASLMGHRAGGHHGSSEIVAKLAWKDADAIFAVQDEGA